MGVDFLEVPSQYLLLLTLFVNCGLGIPNFRRTGLMHHTAVEVGHAPSVGQVVHMLLCFHRSLRFLLTFTPSSFSDHLNIGIASVSPIHLWECTARKEPPTFEFCSSFGDHLEVFCVFGWNVDSSFSATVLLSGPLEDVSDSLGYAKGQFGNEAFKSILL